MFSKLFALATLALAVSATPATTVSSTCDRSYTVASGDNCDTIGSSQHVSFFQLHFVNPVINSDCTNLAVGQVLCLGETGEDCTSVHVVQSGETCSSIDTAASISLGTLLNNNQEIAADCSNLRIDEVLCTAFNNITYTIQEAD